MNAVLFALEDLTNGLVDAYCKQDQNKARKMSPKSSRSTLHTESSRPYKGHRPGSIAMSTMNHCDDTFAEDPIQRTANILLLRENLLRIQSSVCVPETLLRETVATTAGPGSASNAHPATRDQSRLTSTLMVDTQASIRYSIRGRKTGKSQELDRSTTAS
jgi:hypothetical protein